MVQIYLAYSEAREIRDNLIFTWYIYCTCAMILSGPSRTLMRMSLLCVWHSRPPVQVSCGDIHLILRQKIDNLSDFMKYSWAGVREEQERAGKRGEPSVLISYHCPVTPTVTFML